MNADRIFGVFLYIAGVLLILLSVASLFVPELEKDWPTSVIGMCAIGVGRIYIKLAGRI